MHHHVAFDFLSFGPRSARLLLTDAVVELEVAQGVFQTFTDDLRKTLVDHGV